ncbi:SymE family type I addiction module toxin [Enterobacter bugandensis]
MRLGFYDRVHYDCLPLQGEWISQAGFTPGMPILIGVMLDCVVITTQNTRERYNRFSLLYFRTSNFCLDAPFQFVSLSSNIVKEQLIRS